MFICSEKVVIPANKPFIFLEGAGRNNTSIEYGDGQDLPTSATFISYADNVVAKGITIKVKSDNLRHLNISF